jgi:hypothetical protein
VGAALKFTSGEARFLRELLRRRVPFMVVGLSGAALQGAMVVTQDVDLWFRNPGEPRIKRALKAVKGTYVPIIYLNPPRFVGDAVDVFDIVMNMSGLEDFDVERRNAMFVPLGRYRLPVLPLERIIVSKQAANREKDRLVLPRLKNALKTRQSLRRKQS